jgi:protein-tyrosine phosphatase
LFEPSLYWVRDIEPYRLALMPGPRGADELGAEVAGWRRAGIGLVVSLLERSEIRELELQAEPSLSADAGIQFLSFPIADRGTPQSPREFSRLLIQLHTALLNGSSIAIHCRAGVGRTGLVSGCLLRMLGVDRKEIFHILSRARGLAVPDTSAQVEWVEKYTHALQPSA